MHILPQCQQNTVSVFAVTNDKHSLSRRVCCGGVLPKKQSRGIQLHMPGIADIVPGRSDRGVGTFSQGVVGNVAYQVV